MKPKDKEKDMMRVKGIVSRAEGNTDKEVQLAKQMANSIDTLSKAKGRKEAAQELNLPHIAEVFAERESQLNEFFYFFDDDNEAKRLINKIKNFAGSYCMDVAEDKEAFMSWMKENSSMFKDLDHCLNVIKNNDSWCTDNDDDIDMMLRAFGMETDPDWEDAQESVKNHKHFVMFEHFDDELDSEEDEFDDDEDDAELDMSDISFKMDKFMSDDEESQKEYYDILDSDSSRDEKISELVDFFENNIVDEDRFYSYLGPNRTLTLTKLLCLKI